MNTNRNASAHTSRIAARTITMDHILNPVRKGLNTDFAASYVSKVQLGPADNFLAPVYTERVLEVNTTAPASASAPEAEPIGPSGATPVQLLVNSGFTDGTTGWSSIPVFQTTPFIFESGTNPIIVTSINDNGITGSDGYLIFSFSSATVSQSVSITDIANYNIITAVINISRIPNNNVSRPTPDAFSFEIVYKNASNATVATKRTPASGTQSAPTSFTDYTLTFTRDDNVNFDTITSATVNISGIDNGYWLGQHGPAVDYCTLTLS